MGTRKDSIMGILAKSMVALGFVGAMAVGTPSTTLAQGFYIEGPGIEFGVGRPYYRDRYYGYYDYDRPRAYIRPYGEDRRYSRRQRWDWN
jgi:hypothetical protein